MFLESVFEKFRVSLTKALKEGALLAYAAAFESGVAPRHEAMISLKVMQ